MQRESGHVAYCLLRFDIMKNLSRVPLLVRRIGDAEVGGDGEQGDDGDDHQCSDLHRTGSSLHSPPDVHHGDGTGHNKEWNEVSEVARSDIAPYEQSSGGDESSQQQYASECDPTDRLGPEGRHQPPTTQQEEQWHRGRETPCPVPAVEEHPTQGRWRYGREGNERKVRAET